MTTLAQIHQTTLSLPPETYIYKIISTSPREYPHNYTKTANLAVIASDDSLRIFDPISLNLVADGVIKNANASVTCLERVEGSEGNLLATAGRDGFVRFWDARSRGKVSEIQSPHKLISSLVCDASRNFIAAGIENPNDGPAESPVLIWDNRNPTSPLQSYTESHTDTITSLHLHPSHPTLLLTSSTDGLISIFDTSVPDEDDALFQVANHGSAVAHAGFVSTSPKSTTMFAIGTDETVSFHALQSADEDVKEPKPVAWGDVREGLGCEYLVGMHWVGGEAYVVAGEHSTSTLSLIPLQPPSSADQPLNYTYDVARKIVLPDAHGGEVVRDLFTDTHSQTTYTVGEDGCVRAWKGDWSSAGDGDEAMQVDDEGDDGGKRKKDRKERRREKKERKGDAGGEKGRYKPY
ncbi:WD40 repeat-like protein [Aaosphaeria arxii CBS 175.79]|uniref:WD40 repeat-like protein n=1 Tax=Aaosphaeria arxii CBS 175.79 TaxID=1450172 RepID=A0A6A5Y922_9PLEO|nr:WD40 repeat-like protein [Aaosphaeria arxii CBS 175.79]KAF2021084.1 WD40 repeat-like protein [Aaosphaeria arxii CBS 175.79]